MRSSVEYLGWLLVSQVLYVYAFIHLYIEVHVYMAYSKDNTNTILHNIITDE